MELQKYVQAGYIYVPAKEEQHKSWGESSGYRKELDKRNAVIMAEYQNGVSVDRVSKIPFATLIIIGKTLCYTKHNSSIWCIEHLPMGCYTLNMNNI